MNKKKKLHVIKKRAIQKYLTRYTAAHTRRFQQDVSTDLTSDASSSESTEYAEQEIQHTTSDLVETTGDVSLESVRISYVKFKAIRDKCMAQQEHFPSESPFESACETEYFNFPNHSSSPVHTAPQSSDSRVSSVSFSETARSENPYSASSSKTRFRPSRTAFEQEALKSSLTPEGNSTAVKTGSSFESIPESQKSQPVQERQMAQRKKYVIQKKPSKNSRIKNPSILPNPLPFPIFPTILLHKRIARQPIRIHLDLLCVRKLFFKLKNSSRQYTKNEWPS